MTSRRLQLDSLDNRGAGQRRSGPAAPGRAAAQSGRSGEAARVRLVPAHLPRPIGRSRRRKEIVIRPARPEEAAACALVDARYTSTHVWQLDTRHEGDELRISFRQVRLPRELALDTRHRPPAARAGALPRGLLWLVADEVEVLPETPPSAPPLPEVTDGGAAAAPSTIVGYVVAAAARGEANAFLRTLVVDRDRRREGIAGRLLAAAQRWAAAQGPTELMADVPARNYPALRLLQKAGFTFCGFNDRCYPDNEVALFFSYHLR